jgi:hypothetical protein
MQCMSEGLSIALYLSVNSNRVLQKRKSVITKGHNNV